MKNIIKLGLITALMLGSSVQAMDANKEQLGLQLNQAARSGNYEIVKALLAQGAPVDVKDNQGWTPLMRAAENGHQRVCELLLAHHAQIDAKNSRGDTPFNIAVIGNYKAISELLIDAMLRPTKEQRDSVAALLASMKKIGRSKDERFVVGKNALIEIRLKNKQKVLSEVVKINSPTLRNQLTQYVNSK